MSSLWRWTLLLGLGGCLSPGAAFGQIDPVKRDLFQLGYNAALVGHAPLAAYLFYYRNQPDFLSRSNLTLRLAIAPTYLDSELGIRRALGENTDLGIGVAGGGYADSYYEIERGTYLPRESFDGYSAETSLSLYHRFNPEAKVPLTALVRGIAHYAFYGTSTDTDKSFELPEDQGLFEVRTGLRWGGREPTLYPALAMEVSIWYEGLFRTKPGTYGYSGDRRLEARSHLFWGEALLAYTMPGLKHNFYVSLMAGTSADADRFSAYRLGALLPLAAEFPLSLPGYFYQEISARQFVLFGGNYIVPLEKGRRWNVSATASTALVDYLPGLEQPRNWLSGVGAGVFYTSPTWRVMLGYAYGIDAIRTHGQGAHSLGILVQFDLAHAKEAFFKPESTGQWRGLQRIFGVLSS